MIIIETEHLILRDLIKSDIEKRIEWETTDREWQKWDGPWEYEGLSPLEEQANLKEYESRLNDIVKKYLIKSDNEMRYSFQLEVKESSEYIGWINSYCINTDYVYTNGEGLLTIGIDIPPLSYRRKGYGFEAFNAVIQYFISHGIKEIYTQTWSGNERMIALAKKLGFIEICRKKDYRIVNGKQYDGLTFIYKAY